MRNERLKVLIADDEYWVRQAVTRLIDWEEHGFELLAPAGDGEDAWAKIGAERPDIVFLDINMPFLSGIELTRRIQKSYPDIAVLILSGYSEFTYVREALTGGALDYLLKPIDKQKLLAVLEEVTGHLMKRREESQAILAMREKSALAGSMLMDREMSEMLDSASQTPGMLEIELEYTFYHLVQIRIAGLERDERRVRELKDLLTASMCARHVKAFHYIPRADTFYMLVELPEAELSARCQELLSVLDKQTGLPVSILISARKSSFRQLSKALDEIRQIQLTRPFSNASVVLLSSGALDQPTESRISARQQRGLSLAVSTRSRQMFRKICFQEVGLCRLMDGTWRYVEALHALNVIRFILQSGAPEHALTLDSLMELMLVAADRFDGDGVLSILDEMLSEVFGASDIGAGDSVRDIVYQVKSYIDEHYMDELSLSRLAKRFMVDDAYLSRTFKQAVSENLTLYIARRRIERAQEYIAEGSQSLSEIASMVGYDDYAYFNRVFRKIAGVSPSAYKEEIGR